MATRCCIPPESWGRVVILVPFQSDQIEIVTHGLDILAARAPFLERQQDVVVYSAPVEKPGTLKHEADPGSLPLSLSFQRSSIDGDRSRSGALETGDPG